MVLTQKIHLRFASGQRETKRQPTGIDDRMDFGCQSAARPAHQLFTITSDAGCVQHSRSRTRDNPAAIGHKMTVDKAEDYSRRAQEADEKAKSAKTPDLKHHWENVAIGWRLMAEREQKRGKQG